MTASCFKFICLVFWLIWFTSLAFYFGIYHVESNFTYLREDNDGSQNFFYAACIVVAITAMFGCCCIKTDVTHLCCILGYVGFTLVTPIILCSFLWHYHRTKQDDPVLGGVDVLAKIQSHWPRLPTYLHKLEAAHNCCGIFGFKDYRAFIYPSSILRDVPCSCYRNGEDRKDHERDCDDRKADALLSDLFLSKEVPQPYSLPAKIPKDESHRSNFYQDIMAKIYGEKALLELKTRTVISASALSENTSWLSPNPVKAGLYFREGCNQKLNETVAQVNLYSYGFSFALIVFAILMCILVIRNCIQIRRQNAAGSSSQTSLQRASQALMSGRPSKRKS